MRYEHRAPQHLCRCGAPLLARYHLDRLDPQTWGKELARRPKNLWRYAEVLPVTDETDRISLGEGYTPLTKAPNEVAKEAGVGELWLKWEGDNPTGSFKARGMAVAISKAHELGIHHFVVPTAGNAGVAAAAYVQAAGGEIDVFMPADTDPAFFEAAEGYGAKLHRIDGLISDCAKAAWDTIAAGAYDLSTLKEPYRLEGKKTMGYELWEQFDGELPDVIIYPTGGGTGLIGMWKAFAELEELGLLRTPKPRMVTVQMAGCAPMVRAFEHGDERAEAWKDAQTDVLGLRVPGAVGDFLILRALRESGGTAVAVDEDAAFAATREVHDLFGFKSAPEGGAAWAAMKTLKERGDIGSTDRVVLFLTGSAEPYRNILKRHRVTW
jgi:threonine synthase